MIKPALFACLFSLVVTPLAVAQTKPVDKTTIIRSLAPMTYLPQHSGQLRAIDLDIEFKLGSTDLTARARRQLDIVARALKDQQLVAEQIMVIGHTDASGPAAQNMTLSDRRAKVVRDYLVKQGGVQAQRLKPEGQGETRLKNPMAPASGENRRVEFVLIQSANDGRTRRGKAGSEKVIKW